MTDERLYKIFDVASRMFIKQGYTRTQINQIAKAAGIAVGSMYHLFESKEAVYGFVIKCIISPEYIHGPLSLPITEKDFIGLEEEVHSVLINNSKEFDKHKEEISIGYNFQSMISNAFDTISKYARGCLIFEKNTNEHEEFVEIYRQFRSYFFTSVYEYLKLFEKYGHIRKIEDLKLAARFIIESISWWTMDLPYNSFEVQEQISEETAKKVVIDALSHAYEVTTSI
ncbi:helix-turn-helix domain-containing protein [Clostridium kluyveri]|uniref:helix-turn-helix domain-containing protein n=1 Tax=Clostridium kluyveri TaxID=1534 RepID=UPI0022475F3C|nr:helix-turn-helix domain-containing protein [Clostridium kluyveri]UZQ50029.1 TetR/AcrR family transcriptional regulator [Clostridium kluyveri]